MNRWSPRYADGLTPPPPRVEPVTPAPATDAETSETSS